MRLVLQRVRRARVLVEGEVIAEIGPGLLILVGIAPSDTEETVRSLAQKVALLRIFEDTQGKTNLSVKDINGEALVVSQFTLYADVRKGRRPSFTDAAPPDLAAPLVERFAQFLHEQQIPTRTGKFGAHMLVEIYNDGPFTLWLEG